MLYVDKKYISFLKSRVRNFKWKSDNVANFSCPICGDSQTKVTKARGYLFPHKTDYVYKCHNCGVSTSLGKLLQSVDTLLAKEYRTEKFVKKDKVPGPQPEKTTKPAPVVTKVLENAKALTDLPDNHPAIQYVKSRMLPLSSYGLFYWVDNVAQFVKDVAPKYLDRITQNEGRLVIPYFDRTGKNINTIQVRSIDPNVDKIRRYLTMSLVEGKHRPVFGVERVDLTRMAYLTEGAFDSVFLPNCMALGGLGRIKKDVLPTEPKRTTIVGDNEPRNRDVVRNMKSNAQAGYHIFVWPDALEEKDLNELAINGWSEMEILGLVRKYTVSGLKAKLMISSWSKI